MMYIDGQPKLRIQKKIYKLINLIFYICCYTQKNPTYDDVQP